MMTKILPGMLLLLAASCGGHRERCPEGDGVCRGDRDAGADATACVDEDGDGRGTGCAAGTDCDDTDSHQTGSEICDGYDNDCDGEVDEHVLSACGNCDANCRTSDFGGGGTWDLDGDPNDGVAIDDGALVLVRTPVPTSHLIWIANTGEGSVSKVDTRTFTELARYATGPRPLGGGAFGSGNDPSRTSVDIRGDVYVGNREGRSITKISSLGADCPDTNGDGAVTTSSGPTDILPWGMDDCVLWNTAVGGGVIRAVAAQEEMGLDGTSVPVVWVGSWDDQRVYKLDGTTGRVLLSASAPVMTYGFALDGRGQLWIASGGDIGRIDTTRCVDDLSCAVSPCWGDGDLSCVMEVVTVPDGTYGITVDARQRIWLGGGSTAKRYDPMAPPGARWTYAGGAGSFIHGIAADARGNVWGAAMEGGLIRIDAEDPTRTFVIPATLGSSPKGVAIDDDGKVWAINMAHDDATVVVPGATLERNTVWSNVVPQLVQPYTYSDMTGQQLRIATSLVGRYAHVFDACPGAPEGPTAWIELSFDADVPDGTTLGLRIRTADTRDALGRAAWIPAGRAPATPSPIDVAAVLAGAGVVPGALLEVELELGSWGARGTGFVTPRVRSLGVVVSKECDVIG